MYPFEEAASLGQGIIWNCHCGLLGGERSSGWPFPLSCLKGPGGVGAKGMGSCGIGDGDGPVGVGTPAASPWSREGRILQGNARGGDEGRVAQQ